MTPRRILITGGAGFIGYHLARALVAEPGTRITIVDNFARGRRDSELAALLSERNVSAVTADVADPSVWARLDLGFDEVYHLAAVLGVANVVSRPVDVIRVNAVGTLNLLDWVARGGARRVLFASTSEAYAWTHRFHTLPIPTPEEVPLALTDLADPRSSYAGSKMFGELAVTQYCQTYDRPFAIVRYHNVYGPRMGFDHVIPEVLERALGGEDPLVVYSPHHQRAFCFVDDAVEATVAALRAPAAEGRTINVGNDREEISIAELAARLLEHARLHPAVVPGRAASDPVPRRCPDLTRAREILGYEPRVRLDEGLERTVAWYRERLGADCSGQAVAAGGG